MLASPAQTSGRGEQCVVCGANERQHDGKCSSCGDSQMTDRPDYHHQHENDNDNDAATGQKRWYDKHRQCEDGSVHFGGLELITWGGEEAGWELGWGRTQISEVEFMKKKYEQEFGSNDEQLFGYWPQGFR
ncbi:hypothetical protein PG993_012697 [Apiospora rasikravindrae]|uniref:Uncharacterized protein n=1 Tax=Apiospora rasikravindrae TaxID=990691 RepID=A0ABR1S3A3_9PEZI